MIRGGIYSEMLKSRNGTYFSSGRSWTNPGTVAVFPGKQVTLRGVMTNGIENPLTQFVLSHGIIIAELHLLAISPAINGVYMEEVKSGC